MQNPVDWESLKQKVRDLSLVNKTVLSDSEAKRILDERALKLKDPIEQEEDKEKLDLIVFEIGSQKYAIELRYVKEVRMPSLTRLPGTTGYFRGITNLHGEIIAVIDMHFAFEQVTPELSSASQLVVLGEDKIEFGILTDSPAEIIALEKKRSLRAQDLNAGSDYACGLTEDGIVIIDGKRLLTDRRFYLN